MTSRFHPGDGLCLYRRREAADEGPTMKQSRELSDQPLTRLQRGGTEREGTGVGDEDPRQSRIAVVYGTRPEAVKLRGIVGLLGRGAFAIHTGQHYDPE